MSLNEMQEAKVNEEMLKTIEGTAYLIKSRRDGKTTSELQSKVMVAIAESGLTVSEIKGFLDHMKMVVESKANLRVQK